MILYIFIVAALNLGLGFGIAVYLSRQYRASAAAQASGSATQAGVTDGTSWDTQEDPWAEESKESPPAKKQAPEPSKPVEKTKVPEPPVSAETPEPVVEKTPAEESVTNLQSEAQQFNKHVVEADDLLRACAEDPQEDDLQAILGSLAESTRHYLDRREAEGTLKNLSAEAVDISDELQAALLRQDAQIDETSAMIDQFDYQSDLKVGARRMADQTGKLLETNDQLHDTLDDVKQELSENRSSEKSTDPPMDVSPSTIDAPGLEELERELRKFWDDESPEGPQLSIVVVEFDDLRGPTHDSDHAASDVVISASGRLLESEDGGRRSLVLLPHDRCLVLLPDGDFQTATDTAEQLRQLVHESFPDDDPSNGVSIRCGVAETEANDTPRSLANRAVATLRKDAQSVPVNTSTGE